MNEGMYSSSTDMWATPLSFFEKIEKEFGAFTLDVCATKENAKCSEFYTAELDGLTQEWQGRVWMNPPYGKEIGKWVKKAAESARKPGTIVFCLLPARTDTSWWHDYVIKEGSVRFIRGRLKFNDGKGTAPFPSALVVFGDSISQD